MYLVDYHLHTNRSTDAKDALIEVCKSAVEKGIEEIAVTDHFEPISKDPSYKTYNPDKCLKDIEEAQKQFKGLLDIKFGVELGHPHLYPEFSERLLKDYPYDFVLASGHKMRGDVDFSEINYNYSDLDKYCKIYLENLKELVLWGQFDCVGHFDLVRRYAARQRVKIDLLETHKEDVIELLELIIKQGKGIEINTSGLRQYTGDCLPDYGIVKLYNRLGGKIITVGSDAHKAEDVGADITQGILLAEKAGFNHITTFSKRLPRYMNINHFSKRESA